MAKGWKTIYTNADTTTETRAEKVRKARHFDKTIRTTETPTIDQLKRINDYNYEIKVAEEEKLLRAFDEKKVKSKAAIKQAIRIKKERAAEAEKKNEVKTEASAS